MRACNYWSRVVSLVALVLLDSALAQRLVPASTAELLAAWGNATVVTSLYPQTISNDGASSLLAELQGPGCPRGGSRTLYLVFPRASASRQDVAILGTLSDTCNSVTFRAATSIAFQSIQPGVYAVQVTAGRPQAPLTFIAAASKSSGSSGTTAAAMSGAALVTVVDAAVGQLAGDVNVAATSSSLAVTLTAQLAAPALLPATMALQLSDPSAATVSPSALTWRPGEMGPKHFTLQMRRPVGAEGAAQGIVAEALAVSNMVFGDGQSRSWPPRVSVYVPPPTFYVSANTAIYRDGPSPVRRPRQGPTDAAGNGTAAATGNSSAADSTGNGTVSAAATGGGGGAASQRAGASADNANTTTMVMVPVRRASASPFPSTLAFKVQLLEAVGCASRVRCAGAVRGSGQLRFTGDQDVLGAPVWVDWDMMPAEAVLRAAVTLSAVENARVLSYADMLLLQRQQQQQQGQQQPTAGWAGAEDAPIFIDADNVTSLFVFGTTYGVCPAGTAGPWQEPQQAPQEAPGPVAGPSSGSGAGADVTDRDSVQQVISPPRDRVCDDSAVAFALKAYASSLAWLPALSACAAGSAALVLPVGAAPLAPPDTATNASTTPSPAPSPSPSPRPRDANGTSLSPSPSAANATAGSGQDAGSRSAPVELRVPFGMDLAAVFLPLASPEETVVVINTSCSALPTWQTVVLAALPAGAGAGAGVAAQSRPWARWVLPDAVEECTTELAVFATVAVAPALTGSSPRPSGSSPSPASPAPANAGRAAASPSPSPANSSSSPSPAPGKDHRLLTATPAPSPSPSPVPAPANSTAGAGSRAPNGTANGTANASSTTSTASGPLAVPVYSLIQVRSYTLTLRPQSDPGLFPAMALALVHELAQEPQATAGSSTTNRSTGGSSTGGSSGGNKTAGIAIASMMMPLCGLPQPLLYAAARQGYGAAFNASSPAPEQLAWAAATLSQAIRANPDAISSLRQSAAKQAGSVTAGNGSQAAGGAGSAPPKRLLQEMADVARASGAWLADALSGSAKGAADDAADGGVKRLGSRLLRGGGGGDNPDGTEPWRQRRLQQAGNVSPSPSPAPAPLPTASPTTSPSPGVSPGPSPRPSSVSPSPSPGPQPSLASTSSPRPSLAPSPSPIMAVAARAPEGFDLVVAGGGEKGSDFAARVLFNPQYVERCGPQDSLALDLGLLPATSAALPLTLRASSGAVSLRQSVQPPASTGAGTSGNGSGAGAAGGLELQLNGTELVISAATRAAVRAHVEAREAAAALAAAAAAAAASGSPGQNVLLPGGGGGGGIFSTSSKVAMDTSRSIAPVDSGSGSRPPSPPSSSSPSPPSPAPAVRLATGADGGEKDDSSSGAVISFMSLQGASPGPLKAAAAPSPSSPAPSSSGRNASAATSNGTTANATGCDADSLRPVGDQALQVALLAPDGYSTASFSLELFLDYAAAAADAVAAAADCEARGLLLRGDGGAVGGSSNGTAGGATGAAAGAAGAGGIIVGANGTDSGNATLQQQAGALQVQWDPLPVSPLDACRRCGAGSYSAAPNASACLLCGPGTFAGDVVNSVCSPCAAGTYTFTWNSPACRLCPAGTFSGRSGSTACSVCPAGTTTMYDGASSCAAAPPPPSGGSGSTQSALVVSFQMLINMSNSGQPMYSLGANNTGIDASPDSIVKLLIAADTADALRIPPTQVRVSSLFELSPSAFLVNVSATVPLGGGPSGSGGGGSGSDGSPGRDMDADTLISRLVDNPGSSFPRTTEATGGSVQVQYVDMKVVTWGGSSSGLNLHVVLWPTLAGTFVLAVVVGLACQRYCRRRRGGRAGSCVSLPPITDTFGRLANVWKTPSSPPPAAAGAYLVYGQLTSLELQDVAAGSLARHRGRHSRKPSLQQLQGLGPIAQEALAGGSGAGAASDWQPHTSSGANGDLDMFAMYTRDAMAAPRI